MDGCSAHDARAESAHSAPHESTIAGARPQDTSREVWRQLNAKWEAMTPAERAILAAAMSTAIETSVRAGIKASEPSADEVRVRYLVTQRRYGAEIAEAAFGAGGRWPQ